MTVNDLLLPSTLGSGVIPKQGKGCALGDATPKAECFICVVSYFHAALQKTNTIMITLCVDVVELIKQTPIRIIKAGRFAIRLRRLRQNDI